MVFNTYGPTVPPFPCLQVDKGTGADTERLKLKLTLEVEGIEFDAEGGSGVVGWWPGRNRKGSGGRP